MKTLEVHIPEQTASRLEAAAERLHLTSEELLIASLEEKLAQLDSEFHRAADQVISKNAELYSHLS